MPDIFFHTSPTPFSSLPPAALHPPPYPLQTPRPRPREATFPLPIRGIAALHEVFHEGIPYTVYC